jgi:crotonobetainyl-CoA:carnitine CoA-transferase CaiB-like acyl-CoA transferase
VPYRSFRCADAEIAVAVGNDGQFGLFAGVVGHPEWAADPRFARNRDRVANRAELEGMIEPEMRSRSADEWIERLLGAGVPASRINAVHEALADEQTAASGMIVDIEHATAGMFRALGVPMRFSGTPASVRSAPPTLGEHTDAILKERLGLSAEAVKDLRADGIV